MHFCVFFYGVSPCLLTCVKQRRCRMANARVDVYMHAHTRHGSCMPLSARAFRAVAEALVDRDEDDDEDEARYKRTPRRGP